jgi:hypothetical protein
MAIWNVSRVAPPHASLQTITERRQALLFEELGGRTDAEPELAVGTRLFWATIFTVTLVVLIPLMAGWLLRSTPEPRAKMGHPAVVVQKAPVVLDPVPAVVPSLPKAQAPPLELLHDSPGHLASKGD